MARELHFVNERIREPQLRVITADGENLGVLDRNEALNEAHKRGLDLVLIASNSVPPVAKILDFAKFLYDEKKKKSSARSKKSGLKEFKMGPNIGAGDLATKIARAKEFVQSGDRVKFSVVLKGRENMFPEIAFEKLTQVTGEMAEIAKAEDAPKRMGNMVWLVFVRK